MSTETENKIITDKIKADVKKELTARDTLSTGLANLRARKVKLDAEISSNAEKRSKMVLTRQEHTRAGGSDEGLNALIFESQTQEANDKEELAGLDISITDDTGKLKQAETALKRAVFAAIVAHRPDAEVEALAVKTMDAVEQWRDFYNSLVKDLDIKLEGIYDGNWQDSADPRLSNKTNKWFSDFISDISRPEPTQQEPTDDLPPNEPTVQTAKSEPPEPVVKPKGMTDVEAQADARKSGRQKTLRDQHGQTEAEMDFQL